MILCRTYVTIQYSTVLHSSYETVVVIGKNPSPQVSSTKSKQASIRFMLINMNEIHIYNSYL